MTVTWPELASHLVTVASRVASRLELGSGFLKGFLRCLVHRLLSELIRNALLPLTIMHHVL
jgi:hypothetical protein